MAQGGENGGSGAQNHLDLPPADPLPLVVPLRHPQSAVEHHHPASEVGAEFCHHLRGQGDLRHQDHPPPAPADHLLEQPDVDGGLADVLEITVKDGDKVLYSGKAADLIRENVGAADDMLKLNERRNLTVYFHFPEKAGNAAQNHVLTFSMSADAVQTKNNPNKLFD